jgi:hypothetical protein
MSLERITILRLGGERMASILKRRNPSGKVVYRVQFKDQFMKQHEAG